MIVATWSPSCVGWQTLHEFVTPYSALARGHTGRKRWLWKSPCCQPALSLTGAPTLAVSGMWHVEQRPTPDPAGSYSAVVTGIPTSFMWFVTDVLTESGVVPVLMSAASRFVVSPNGLMLAWHARHRELSSVRVTTGTPSSTSVRIWCAFVLSCGSWQRKQLGTNPECGAWVPSSRSSFC